MKRSCPERRDVGLPGSVTARRRTTPAPQHALHARPAPPFHFHPHDTPGSERGTPARARNASFQKPRWTLQLNASAPRSQGGTARQRRFARCRCGAGPSESSGGFAARGFPSVPQGVVVQHVAPPREPSRLQRIAATASRLTIQHRDAGDRPGSAHRTAIRGTEASADTRHHNPPNALYLPSRCAIIEERGVPARLEPSARRNDWPSTGPEELATRKPGAGVLDYAGLSLNAVINHQVRVNGQGVCGDPE
jgi:hypothetical protein